MLTWFSTRGATAQLQNPQDNLDIATFTMPNVSLLLGSFTMCNFLHVMLDNWVVKHFTMLDKIVGYDFSSMLSK